MLEFSDVLYLLCSLLQHVTLRYVQKRTWLYDNSDDRLRVSCLVLSVFGLPLLYGSVSQKTSTQRET